ncbi:P-type ATPase [Streptomyces sp. NPDC002767]
MPVDHAAAPGNSKIPDRVKLEARNCVFVGTDVVGGTGKAVVSATGTATEFGRIFRLTAATPRQKSPEVRLLPGDEILLVSHEATEQEIHAAFQ